MIGSVRVATTARLHLGFLDLNGGLSRQFGSIGLSLDAPATRLSMSRAAEDDVRGLEAERAAAHLRSLADSLGIADRHAVTIESAIPPHAGLGSGTQMALAVAAGLRRLHGLAPATRQDAALLERGARSGIGVALFDQGGFVVDGGRGKDTAVPPLLARLPVPETWRVLVILDRARQGLYGAGERTAFADLAPMQAAASAEICRLVMMQMLPALAEADLRYFGSAITKVQEIVGDHFAPAQDGRYASAAVTSALSFLAAHGAHGVGQSSWGPTGFAFAASAADAERLSQALARTAPAGLDIVACRALNRGALIEAV